MSHQFVLQRTEETFHGRVVVAITLAIHVGDDPAPGEHQLIETRPIEVGRVMHGSGVSLKIVLTRHQPGQCSASNRVSPLWTVSEHGGKVACSQVGFVIWSTPFHIDLYT